MLKFFLFHDKPLQGANPPEPAGSPAGQVSCFPHPTQEEPPHWITTGMFANTPVQEKLKAEVSS